jgi:hypothetical protein
MPTRIQATPVVVNPSPQTFVETTFAAPPAVGNSIVVVVVNNGTASPTSVIDTIGVNAYVGVGGRNNPAIPASIFVYLGQVVTTGSPFTVRANGGSSQRMIQAFEITSALAQNNNSDIGSGTLATAPSFPPPPRPTFALGVVTSLSAGFTVTPDTPAWVQESEQLTTAPFGELDSRVVAPSASQVVSWTLATTNPWLAMVVAFQDGPTPPMAGAPAGQGAIANLQGKVTDTNALDISTTVALADATRTGHLDSDAHYFQSVLIPAPAADEQIIVTALSASVLVAGAFAVTYRTTDTTRVLGPIWLPASGPVALTSGRTFETGPILRALPPGQGLTVTTSVDAPQSFDAEYQIVSVA